MKNIIIILCFCFTSVFAVMGDASNAIGTVIRTNPYVIKFVAPSNNQTYCALLNNSTKQDSTYTYSYDDPGVGWRFSQGNFIFNYNEVSAISPNFKYDRSIYQSDNTYGSCDDYPPPCSSLSDVTVSLTQSQCVEFTSVYSNNIATQGTLQYQECDNTCYVLEPMHIPCSTVIPYLKQSCDIDTNSLHLTCNDANSDYTTYVYQCTPDINNTNPCQDAYNTLSVSCTNGTIQGSCQDNGMQIISNTLNCEPSIPDPVNPCKDIYNSMLTQCNVNNQILIGNCSSKDGNISSNTYRCVPKFTDNNSSNNTISLTDTNNLLSGLQSDISVVNNNLNDFSNSANNINNKLSNTNDKLSSLNNKSDLINNKLTSTNNNLNDIKNINKSSRDILKDIKNGVDGSSGLLQNILDAFNSQSQSDMDALNQNNTDITSFFDSAKNDLYNIRDQFDETMILFSSGFTYTPPSVGVCTNPSAFIYNKTIELDICTPFQKFRPIFYLLFTMIFTFIAIKIFYMGIKL